ncbi:hypothetical protein C8Q77DRAFT_90504 [Trametes polyzona]|nr:hypothetical protein C8Q77DRAFT_90504 [Trametes polyzona]
MGMSTRRGGSSAAAVQAGCPLTCPYGVRGEAGGRALADRKRKRRWAPERMERNCPRRLQRMPDAGEGSPTKATERRLTIGRRLRHCNSLYPRDKVSVSVQYPRAWRRPPAPSTSRHRRDRCGEIRTQAMHAVRLEKT